jgi:hypothetical protein
MVSPQRTKTGMRPSVKAFLFPKKTKMRRPPKRDTRKYCLLRDYEVRDLLCGDKLPDCSGNHHAHISPIIAAELEREGIIEPVRHLKVQNAFMRVKGKQANGKLDPLKAPTLIYGEIQANAGLYGRSRTARLSEMDKNLRIAQGLPAEDFIEKAELKVDIWPLIGDDKSVRVGPSVDVTAIYTALDLVDQQRHSQYLTVEHSTSFGQGYSVTRRV